MNKTLLPIAAAIISLPIIGWQFAQNSKLKTEVSDLEAVIVGYERSTESRGGLTAMRKGDRNESKPEAENGTGALATDDPSAFLAEGTQREKLGTILAMRDPLARVNALMAYVGSLDESELQSALEQLRKDTPEWDPDARVAANLMLTRWGKADPDGALEYLSGLDRRRAGGDAAIIISALASTDPQRAIKWLEDPENKLKNFPWMGQILAGSITKEWVRDDPDAALEWAKSVPENQRSGAYSGVLGTIAATDPQRASAMALELPESNAREEIIAQISRSWSESSPAEALEWAQGLEGDERSRAVGEALGSWAQTDPESAAEFITSLPEDERTAGMVKRVTSTWARQEPAAAAQWVGDLPEGDEKKGAIGDVMWNWTTTDPTAASTWLLEQPAGESRDEGIGSLARVTFESDPEGALTWAAHMSSDERRLQSVAIGIHAWRERDQEAADAWLENTDTLSAEEVENIIARREGNDRE